MLRTPPKAHDNMKAGGPVSVTSFEVKQGDRIETEYEDSGGRRIVLVRTLIRSDGETLELYRKPPLSNMNTRP